MDGVIIGNVLVALIQAAAQLGTQLGKTPEEVKAMLVTSFQELEAEGDPGDLPEG